MQPLPAATLFNDDALPMPPHVMAHGTATMCLFPPAAGESGIRIAEAAITGDHVGRALGGRCVVAVPIDVTIAGADDGAPWRRPVFRTGHSGERQEGGQNGGCDQGGSQHGLMLPVPDGHARPRPMLTRPARTGLRQVPQKAVRNQAAEQSGIALPRCGSRRWRRRRDSNPRYAFTSV